MTDYDALDPDDAWSEPESPEPEAWSSEDEPPPPRPETTTRCSWRSTRVRPPTTALVDLGAGRLAVACRVDPNASGEWIADVERPAES